MTPRKTAAAEASHSHQVALWLAQQRYYTPKAVRDRQAARRQLRADLEASRPKETP